ncbi:arylsulfatase [Capnocytophaga sp.]|uniref:arylsulfatase n=1 Tax=Capnocytophaga sp. TaxID=44737 RepID=UPI0026DCA049|nr:arylsulfatase [Capnocytophaga sp.]MDO5104817.1 arylsulfatase [Capnocytophaga sp.]
MNRFLILFVLLCNSIFAQQTPPNIIFILADDLGYGDIEPYGQKIIKTPHLLQLANEGMKFTNFYSGAPVCAPSRASVITGQTTGETHIRGNKEVAEPIDGQAPILANSPSIAKILKQAGYNTGVFGKWALGTVISEGNPLLHGFDTFFGYNSQFRAHRRYPAFLWDNNQKVELTENGYYQHQKIYAEDLIHQKALEFIKKQSADNPFFTLLTYTLPHAELAVPKDSIFESYRHLAEKPYKGKDYDKITPDFPGFSGYMSQPYPHATHAAMVSRLDKYVGDIRTLLKEKGMDNNTVIIFASDNGAHREGGADPEFFNATGGLRGFKRDVYEGGIRTPFIVYWGDKITPAGVSHHVGAFWDLMPTFADIAGVKYQPTKNQVSFLPTLLGKKQKAHKHLYWEFHELGGRQAVRYKNWKGIRLNVDADKNAPIELYDLNTDPAETTNIAEKHPKIVKKIAKIMEQSHTKSTLFPFKWEK